VDARFEPEPFPPLFSPSAYKRLEAEPLPLPDPEEGEAVPGRARAIGTLVHYAIGQNWSPDNPQHLANLEAQEVMFPFGPDERKGIMAEVQALLEHYQELLGRALPWPRDEDYPEFAVALPLGSTVWQGVIDRLYRVGQQWYLEDYKTDQEMRPEQYFVQLGIYLTAIRQAWQIEPEVRLVYLRFGWVERLDKAILEAALGEIMPKGEGLRR
jgi:ATP-dependent exoDNAse (exonuclease V) beta subunit